MARSASTYCWVVAVSSWPSQRALTVMSSPDWSRCMAVVWRSVWGETRRVASEGVTVRGLSAGDAQLMFDPGARQGLACAIGKQVRVGASVNSGVPHPELRCGALPERNDTFLASLAVQKEGGRPIEKHVGDVQTGELGDADAGVVEHDEEDGVALSAPSAPVRSIDDRRDLLAGQVAEDGPI